MPDRPTVPVLIHARGRRVVLLAAVAALLFLGSTFAPALLDQAGSGWGGPLRLLFAPACHQMPERSLLVGAGHQAVCARCSGLYVGGALGLGLAALAFVGTGRRLRRWWLLAAFAPSVIDFLLPWIGLPDLPNVPRLVVAVPAGAMAALFLAVGLADLFAGETHSPRTPSLVPSVNRALEEADG